MRFSAAFLAVGLLLPMFLPVGLAASPRGPPPLQLTFADVPTWNVGDTWTFLVHSVTQDGPNRTETWANLTQVVAGLIELPAGSSTLYLYNSTVSGNLSMSGSMWDPGTGFTVTFRLSSTDLSGYAWVERGDLALVRTNQTFSGNGTADIPVFGTRGLMAIGGLTAISRPPREEFDFPIETGDTWRLTSVTNTSGNIRIVIDMAPLQDIVVDQPLAGDVPTDTENWVNESGLVVVPAGSFDALHIRSEDAGGLTEDLWYAPNATNYVRRESHEAAGPQTYAHSWTNLTSYVPANPAFVTSVTLVPRRVGPGMQLAVSTTTAPFAALRIIIPARNSTTFGVANSAGQDTHFVSAPVYDDNTPSPVDVGSHGVLVEADNGVTTSYAAATVELDPPNLTMFALTGSPSTVIDGEFITFTATVLAEPPLGWPVNVTFVEEDVDVNDDGVLDLPLATFCARSACGTSYAWILSGRWGNATMALTFAPPSLPSVVTVSVIVDPDDDFREVSETDNILSRDILVQASDLAPANVSVGIGATTYAFDDPAAFGFVSPLIPIASGARADLSVRARNVGAVNATRPTVLALYNTTVLNGSGDPPFAQFSVPRLAPGESGAPANASWTAPVAAGTYFVNMTVDRGGALRETSEANNTFVVRLRTYDVAAAPDLIPTSVTIPTKASVGRPLTITARVVNGGLGNASGSQVAFYNGTERTEPFARVDVGPLGAGTTSSVISVTWSSMDLGPHEIWVEVDYANAVPEADETNNVLVGTVTVYDVPATSLVIGSPKVVAGITYVHPLTSLSLFSPDRTGEGPPTIWLRLDSDPWVTMEEGRVFTIALGPHRLTYNATDRLGGIEPSHVADIYVDGLPPETVPTVANASGGKVVSLVATDVGVGLNWTEYRVDGGAWTRYTSSGILITDPGNHSIEFRSADLLGNVEANRTVFVLIEGAPANPAAGFNVKPILAAIFAAMLFLAGWFATPSPDPPRRRRWLLTVVLPPALLELATGAVSLGVPEMAVPGGSLGVPVDTALLLIGMFVIYVSRRKSLRPL